MTTVRLSQGDAPIQAIATASHSTFVTVGADGAARLWDLRRPATAVLSLPLGDATVDAMEVLVEAATTTAWAIAGNVVLGVEFRAGRVSATATCPPRTPASDATLYAMDARAYQLPEHRGGTSLVAEAVLVGNDDGDLFATPGGPPSDAATTMTPVAGIESHPDAIGCGFALLPRQQSPSSLPLLLRSASDGVVQLFEPSPPQQEAATSSLWSMPWAPVGDPLDGSIFTATLHRQLPCAMTVNPPLPTVVAPRLTNEAAMVAVGRADGSYLVLDIAATSVPQLRPRCVARGHEANPLVALAWGPSSNDGSCLVTSVASSGEVSTWDLGPALDGAVPDPEDEEGVASDDEPEPRLVFVGNVREATAAGAVANTAILHDPSRLVVGTSDGALVVCTMDP